MYSLSIRYRNIKQFDKTERSESVRPPWPQDMQWKMSTNYCVQKKWLNIETLYSFLLIRSSWKSGYCNINHLLRKKLFPMTRLYSFHKGFRSEYADPFPSLRSALKLFFFLTLLMAKYLYWYPSRSLPILQIIKIDHSHYTRHLKRRAKNSISWGKKKKDFIDSHRVLITCLLFLSIFYCYGFVVINYVRNILS